MILMWNKKGKEKNADRIRISVRLLGTDEPDLRTTTPLTLCPRMAATNSSSESAVAPFWASFLRGLYTRGSLSTFWPSICSLASLMAS